MLRKINSALFEAPLGAAIQIVVQSQGNNGVNDARFEYGGQLLPRQTIIGLPGCSFPVASVSQLLEAGVVFDPSAPGSARYDMFEVENGVPSALGKSVANSDSSALLAFTIDPVAVAVTRGRVARGGAPIAASAGVGAGDGVTDATTPAGTTRLRRARKAAKQTRKGAKKTAARKQTARKQTARKQPARKRTANKPTARKRTAAKATKASRKSVAAKKKTATTRRTSRKRPK